ncbi:MAG: DUF4118 domain-containing protein [Candidatus Pacebacteria bacterium]|nr:DUF4118 domain-containing protein [Candidatus Paceibacterota bacterium]
MLARFYKATQTDPNVGSLVWATATCAMTTLIALCLFTFFDAPNLVALFMFTVVMVSLRFGRVAAIWSALLSVTSFDFLFIPPRLSFATSDTQYFFTLALFLLVALATSEVGGRLRLDAKIARRGERRETAVARVAHDLSGASTIEQITTICIETFAPLFEADITLLLPVEDDALRPTADGAFQLPVAQWVYDHVLRAGLGTETFCDVEALYLPLKAPIRCRGVLAIKPKNQAVLKGADEKRLLEACCSSIALALERIHFVDVFQKALVRMEGERLRNSLLSAISHDLRTPLTVIRGLAETLETAAPFQPSDKSDIAGAIRQQAEELQRLVTNLLDLARMQSDGVKLEKQWHSIEEIVGITLGRLGPALSNRQIRTRFPKDLPLIEVDACLFERVLFNLIDNAFKYAKDAEILIGAQPSGDSMYCFVEDSGPGLPPGDSERLFEPFARGKTESSIAGVGLGLALCRNIITAHGGIVRAEAKQPSGTRFEIRLPLGTPPKFEMNDIECISPTS